MKLSEFKNIEEVVAKYPLAITKARFIPTVELAPTAQFMEDLEFTLTMQTSIESEMFYRESYIFPFMRQVWKRHPKLKLWINRKLAYEDELIGAPDYFVAPRVETVSDDLVGRPLLAVVEAKQEDFIAGWGQCLAAMIACQKLNGSDETAIYGIVSAGEYWQFAKLVGDTFTQNIAGYTIHEPAKLLGVLDYIFDACEKGIK